MKYVALISYLDISRWPVRLVRKVIEKRRSAEEVEEDFEGFSSSLREMVPRYNEHWNKEE
jgi:hypothetical protein